MQSHPISFNFYLAEISFTWTHRVAACKLQLGKMLMPLRSIAGHSRVKIFNFKLNKYSFGKYVLCLGSKVEKN